jgi:cytidine deaminase
MSPFDTLREIAARASRQAHAPYSGCHVGAALLSTSGQIHAGCNVENAALGSTSCAERGALAAAVLAEGPALRLTAMAVIAFDRNGNPLAAPPCGACRQALVEFGADVEITFLGADGQWSQTTLDALLPHRFELATGSR